MTSQKDPIGKVSYAGYVSVDSALPRSYHQACRLAELGRHEEAHRIYTNLGAAVTDLRLKALIDNDLAVLSALNGDLETASEGLLEVLALGGGCEPAALNDALLQAERTQCVLQPLVVCSGNSERSGSAVTPIRVAIVSLLFNWPSTGGGTVHTAELAQFLIKAGYEVRHFYARYTGWGVGNVESHTPYPSQALDFDDASWNVPEIKTRFWKAVDAFGPDSVIITDSWNMKPHLAEALSGYPYILRFQAMECLCPLNNVRLLPEPGGRFAQCPLDQLANPAECVLCVRDRGRFSGSLHQAERELSGFGSPGYHATLVKTIREAEAVLVVNPLTEDLVKPYAKCVRVVTAGMDPGRFTGTLRENDRMGQSDGRKTLLFAGLVDEWMKGYRVLHEACRKLWRRRQDFELVATGEPAGQVDAFTRFVGWQSQQSLPGYLDAADVLVMPTIAQEGLGRTAVEAMAASRPVVASRIGGLPVTVVEGATGLLCEPGDPDDLARKIETLLDDRELRERMGAAGRRRFEEFYSWDVIVEKHYRPLLKRRDRPTTPHPPYSPFIPDRVDIGAIVEGASRLFNLARSDVEAKFQTYRAFHDAKGYVQTLGEFKTLCFEEAFLIYVALSVFRPRTVVEVGTQHGKSTRRILDMATLLGLGSRVVCFDVTDEVQYFDPREAELVVSDVTGHFRQSVLNAYEPQLVFLDVHCYPLLREAVVETMAGGNRVLIVHDCGRGRCNPHMMLAKDDPAVTSLTGVWERHILAEVFGIDDPLSTRLDTSATPTHRMRVFDTPHGLAVIVPASPPIANRELGSVFL